MMTNDSQLSFLQSEHKKVLDGLQEEIRRLQQRCSELQFSLTTTTSQVKESSNLREQLQKSLDETQIKDKCIVQLETKVSRQGEEIQELRQQLHWQQVQFRNQLQSKDSKIDQLQKSLNLNSGVERLRDECKKLYESENEAMSAKMDDIVARAREPNHSDNQLESVMALESSSKRNFALNSLPNPVSTRSKVFRHKLQEAIGPAGSARRSHSSLLFGDTDSTILPIDYRASVSTLPPIKAGRSMSLTSQISESESLARVLSGRRISTKRKSEETPVQPDTMAETVPAVVGATAKRDQESYA